MSTPETDTKLAPSICKRPGCTIPLSSRNQIGLCSRHVRWMAPGEKSANSPAPTNGHAHAQARGNGVADGVQKTGNGAANRGNGHAITADHEATTANGGKNGATAADSNLDPARVDHLIATLPPADRAKIAVAWLRGQL